MRMTLGSRRPTPPAPTKPWATTSANTPSWGVDQAYVKVDPLPGAGQGPHLQLRQGAPSPSWSPQDHLGTPTWFPKAPSSTTPLTRAATGVPFVTRGLHDREPARRLEQQHLRPSPVRLGSKGKSGAFSMEGAAGYNLLGRSGRCGQPAPQPARHPHLHRGAGLKPAPPTIRCGDVYAKAAFKFSPKGSVGMWGPVPAKLRRRRPSYQGQGHRLRGGGLCFTYDKFKVRSHLYRERTGRRHAGLHRRQRLRLRKPQGLATGYEVQDVEVRHCCRSPITTPRPEDEIHPRRQQQVPDHFRQYYLQVLANKPSTPPVRSGRGRFCIPMAPKSSPRPSLSHACNIPDTLKKYPGITFSAKLKCFCQG